MKDGRMRVGSTGHKYEGGSVFDGSLVDKAFKNG
jgi:hypothetical protein